MTQDELDAIPDDVWVQAHDITYPRCTEWIASDKIKEARIDGSCQDIARLLMQLRAKDAEIAALKGDDPDLLAARKIAADSWRKCGGEERVAKQIENGEWHISTVQCALRGIKHGREQSQ